MARRSLLVAVALVLSTPLAVLAAAAIIPTHWFYRDRRPTRAGRAIGSFWASWSALGLPPYRQVALETVGRKSGRVVTIPVVVTHYRGQRYLVSMLGPGAAWVRNVEAASGYATLRQRRRTPILLQPVPVEERAPILQSYLRAAPGARPHFSISQHASLARFAAVAAGYPVFHIRPATPS